MLTSLEVNDLCNALATKLEKLFPNFYGSVKVKMLKVKAEEKVKKEAKKDLTLIPT